MIYGWHIAVCSYVGSDGRARVTIQSLLATYGLDRFVAGVKVGDVFAVKIGERSPFALGELVASVRVERVDNKRRPKNG